MLCAGTARIAVIAIVVAPAIALAQVPVTSTWDATTDVWSQTGAWDALGGADLFPDNNASFEYDVVLPANAGTPYTVGVDVGIVELLSLNVDADAILLLSSTDFRPGALTNAGLIELQTDDLFLDQSITNNATLTFDSDTGSEFIRLDANVTFNGTGTLRFPDIATTSTSVHRVLIFNNQGLTNGAGHTIEGGPGSLSYQNNSFFSNGFVNNGEVRANVNGKTLLIDGLSDDLEVVNNNLLAAENGGTLEFDDLFELINNGTISCDATSVIVFDGMSTALDGTVMCDGAIRLIGSSFLNFAGTVGSGGGEYRQESGATTFGLGTTIEFGTVNIESGTLTVNTSALITVRDLFTHALTIETNHTFDPTTGVRITGGTAAGPTDFNDFAAIEIAGIDMGNIPAGFSDNFQLPNLIIGPGAKVNLFDVFNNGNRDGSAGTAEALYVDTLTFEDSAGLLNLNGHNLYFNTLVGVGGQIVDSGGGSGKAVPTNWICTTDTWSESTCWDALSPGDTHPNNGLDVAYEVSFPSNAGTPYFVTVDTGPVTVRSVDVDADTRLFVNSTDFDPGLLTNDGIVELQLDDLFLGQSLTNNGTIRFDTDTGSEFIRLDADVSLNGTGTLLFPDIATTSTSTHRVLIFSNQGLTNGAGHTIEGGPGSLSYQNNTFFSNGFVNDGTVRANVSGKALVIDGLSDDLELVNNNLLLAENGGTLEFDDLIELVNNGTIGCDASSTIIFDGMATALDGTVNCDGLLRLIGSSSINFDGTVGTGAGEYRQESGATTYGFGTILEFGTVNIETGTFTVNAGAIVTVGDLYTHALTVETSHTFDPTSAVRITGGTAAGPTDFNDFAAIEIAGVDLGTDPVGHIGDPGGFVDNFHLPRLIVGPGAKANLFDAINNGNRDGAFGAAEALYVDTLEFEDTAGLLNLNGHHLYFNTLVGLPGQIVDSGGGSGKAVVTNWICASDSWSQTSCWDTLLPGDAFPDNRLTTVYDVTLPANGGSNYTVTTSGAADVTVRAVSIDADANLVVNSTDFDPGLLTNSGVVELALDDLFFSQNLTNDGTIRFDTDTGSEFMRLDANVTFNGTGTLQFPDIATTSTSVHRVLIFNNQGLVNGVGHTIEGGPGSLSYQNNSFFSNGFVNDGTVRANVSGKTLLIDGLSDDLELVNNNLLVAENGGTLEFDDLIELVNNGTISCDASSVVIFDGMATALSGTVNCDGLIRLIASASVNFSGAVGSGGGEYRQEFGSTTFGLGTTVEFGTVDIQSGLLTVDAGGLLTIRNVFTHSITSESSHTFAATAGLRVTGTGCSPPATVEVAGTDRGDVPAGFLSNFQLPRLIIGAGAIVELVDDVDNGNRNGPAGVDEALYVDEIEFEDGTGRIIVNNLNLYFNTLIGDPAQIGLGVDCNANASPDECDTALGTSPDCNANVIPDECEIPVASGGLCTVDCDADCNINGVPDACDIADVTSTDLNTNGIPDECEDCQPNGVPDALDIIAGTSTDCDADGTPDECQGGFSLFQWIGSDGGSFTDPANWDLAGVPGGDADLSNAATVDNRAVLSNPGETTLCTLTVGASGTGAQIVQVDSAAALHPTDSTAIDIGGQIDLQGGSLDSEGGVSVDGSLTGFGTVSADVTNSGVIEGLAGGALTFSGSTFDNQATGSLTATAGSLVVVQSSTLVQAGAIEARTLAGVVFSQPLTNAGNISLLGGSVSADGITNNLTITGFGTIDAGTLTNDGDVVVTATTQIVGDVINNATVTVQSGLLTITGSLSGPGTIIGDFTAGPMPAAGDGLTVIGDYAGDPTASLTIRNGVFRVGGAAFSPAIDDFNRFDLAEGTLQFVGLPGGSQNLEMLAGDIGNVVTLPDTALFSLDTLRVGPPATTVALTDTHDNTPGGGDEVLYVNNLILDQGVTLDLNSLVIYYRSVTPADPFDVGSGVTVIDSVGGGNLIMLVECNVATDCADTDGNGATDDVCAWWACDSGTCSNVPKAHPSDMGGAFGACSLDTFCNLADALHALTCFSNDNSCDSINIDAGGAFGACAPDGFCNLADALHALTCFSGDNVCACGPSPNFTPEPNVVGRTMLSVVADGRTIAPGDEVQVRVFMNAALPNIGAYQLHSQASGGRAGFLELVEITIEDRKDSVFAAEPDPFDAFNVANGQMLSGLFSGSVASERDSYLATLTYRASANAVGTFVVDILHDQANQDQTFLVGAEQTDKIEIAGTKAAVITVISGASRNIR